MRSKILTTRAENPAGALRRPLLVMLALVIAACGTSPPVQEMSDARQAISVAKEAGAEMRATKDLREAEEHLASAEKYLADRAYAEAREDAKLAKMKALSALALSEQPELPK